MSGTRQDDNVAPTANAPLASESTPAKKKYGPDLPYTSALETFEQVRRQLGNEMNGRWLGPMPVDAFLKAFVPAAKQKLPPLPKDPFKKVPKNGVESARYRPFIAAIRRWIPSLKAVNTSTKEDTANNLKLKTDISVYKQVRGVAPPNRTDFSQMELWMEFKGKSDGVAFEDPCDDAEASRLLAIKEESFTPATVKGITARGQLAHYAGAQHSLQFRHFSFSVVIHGDQARLLRWDPSGTIVSAAFNYRTNAGILAEFLWRFDKLSASGRGHDQSIQPANLPSEVDARVREKLGVKNDVPLYRYELPGLTGMGYAYGPRPPTQNRSLVSRCTRNLPVVWTPEKDPNGGTSDELDGSGPSQIERDADFAVGQDEVDTKGPWSDERVIYMKDTWRYLSDSPDVEIMPEHEIYAILHKHNTPNIPEHVAGGDVDGGRTITQDFVDAPWLCVRPRISPYQHYRLVHRVVGRALFKFECTKQLVSAVSDALEAHSHAVENARILHRDISSGNIILTSKGKGLLIDWELAKNLDEDGSRRPDRTGTWQFMSANLLQHPGKIHTFTDDLESFLHVLGWMTLRYVPAVDEYGPVLRDNDMSMFDECYQEKGRSEQGGDRKRDAFCAESYPSRRFWPKRETPIWGLVRELGKPFKSLYGRPPTLEERERINAGGSYDDSDCDSLDLRAVRRYDRDMARLASSTWFSETMKTTLDKKKWPTDDKANEDFSIASSKDTERQVQNKISQLQKTHSILERSRGLKSSKRAASPTPHSSAKRRRVSPPVSGSRI